MRLCDSGQRLISPPRRKAHKYAFRKAIPMKMNLPNKLTVLRLIMVPIFMVVMLLPVFADFSATADMILTLLGALLFIAASVTDMLDGKIARKYNLVTDFGKFLDPLADKFMVIGAMLCILFTNAHNIRMFTLYFFALIVVVFRELAVTSIRLVASSTGGVVIAANLMGKMKTVTQIVAICAAIIEPILYKLIFPRTHIAVLGFPPITLLSTALMIYLTIHSGINYIVGAWKYLDPEK